MYLRWLFAVLHLLGLGIGRGCLEPQPAPEVT